MSFAITAPLMFAGSGGAALASSGWQLPTVISQAPPGGYDTPVNVAVDAKGDALAVWTAGLSAVVFGSFRPAGADRWSKPQEIGTGIYDGRAAVAFDGAGDATVAFTAETGLLASTRRAVTGKWGSPKRVSPPDEGPPMYFSPALGVDAAGDAVLAWTTTTGYLCGCVDEVSYRPAGGNWQPPTKRSGYSLGLAVASDGSMVLAYLGVDDDTVRAETGFRGVWSAPVELGHQRENFWSPGVAIEPGGDAAVVWTSIDPGFNGIAYGAVRTGGAWQPTQPISFLDGNAQFGPNVGIDARGNVLALFETGSDLDATYRPAGGAWERPVLVPDFLGDSLRDSSLAMNAAGQVVVPGIRSEDVGPPYTASPLAGVAYTPGIGWGPSQRLDADTGGSASPAAAIDPAGDAIVAWEHHAPDNASNASIESAILDAGGPLLHAVFNHAPPRISGNARPGRTLRCSTGTWTGDPPITFQFRWLRGSHTVGSTPAHRVRLADAGNRLTCQVTATNTFGSITASSPPKRTVTYGSG